MAEKNRKQKAKEYQEKYGDIPIDQNERLEWMIDKYHLSEKKMEEILDKKTRMLTEMAYTDIFIRLLEVPEGAKRPRFRIINKKNIGQAAALMPQFVHVYSPNAHDDHVYMERLMNEGLLSLQGLLYSPVIVEFNAFFKTPSYFSITDKFLAEIGLIRQDMKPDWDNIGKKYSDMFNSNVWVDDSSTISGTVNKYYSELPRVEIKIRILNRLYNKKQYDRIKNKIGEVDMPFFK